MEKILIEPIRPDEIDEIAVLLSRAFSPVPINRMVFGEPGEEQLSLMENGFKAMLPAMDGEMLCTKDDGKVVGFMRIVEWPDCQKPMSEDIIGQMPEEIAKRMGEWLSTWAQHDPKEPHWHLSALAVLPEMQGRGIGSAMLKHFCGHVDDLGQSAYLETDQKDNVRLYQRFGFNVVEEAPVLSIPNYFMLRPTHG